MPTGLYRRGNAGSPGHTTHIYARGHWDAPVSAGDLQVYTVLLLWVSILSPLSSRKLDHLPAKQTSSSSCEEGLDHCQGDSLVPMMSSPDLFGAQAASVPQVAHLPVLASPVVAVAFCPQLFALRPPVPGDAVRGAAAGSDAAAAAASAAAAAPAASPAAAAGVVSDENALVQLPYRMVFVVATTDSVFLYDTQVPPPCDCLPLKGDSKGAAEVERVRGGPCRSCFSHLRLRRVDRSSTFMPRRSLTIGNFRASASPCPIGTNCCSTAICRRVGLPVILYCCSTSAPFSSCMRPLAVLESHFLNTFERFVSGCISV